MSLDPRNPGVLAPGVQGYTVRTNGTLYVPLVIADRPGNGDVGRFLDSLPLELPIVVPGVVSQRLASMLFRRGYRVGWEWFESAEEWVECFYREPEI